MMDDRVDDAFTLSKRCLALGFTHGNHILVLL